MVLCAGLASRVRSCRPQNAELQSLSFHFGHLTMTLPDYTCCDCPGTLVLVWTPRAYELEIRLLLNSLVAGLTEMHAQNGREPGSSQNAPFWKNNPVSWADVFSALTGPIRLVMLAFFLRAGNIPSIWPIGRISSISSISSPCGASLVWVLGWLRSF